MIDYELTGARRAGLRFEEFPEKLRAKLEEHIQSLTDRLYAAVQDAEPRRTGKLAGETAEIVREGADFISGRVRITAEFGKAAALEYGAHGTITVKSHEARLDHLFGQPWGPRDVTIGAHERRLDIDAHEFLRGPLAAMRPDVEAELHEAILESEAESV